MVLAAGIGTRLRPITYALPKPMVPVLDRPLMAHIVDLLERQGFTDLIANLHHRPDAIRDHFGSRLAYRVEDRLLGTAGGVRNVADFFDDGDPIVVVSGDALTDTDVRALVRRHRETGGIATLAVKRCDDTRGLGVVDADGDGRVRGFQEKPGAGEARSNLVSCGIYCFSQRIFDYFPPDPVANWPVEVFPALFAADVPFHVHEIDDYWNDVGSVEALRRGTWDLLAGRVRLEVGGTTASGGSVVGDPSALAGVEVETAGGPVWVGDGVSFGPGVRLIGPVAVGDGCVVGAGAALSGTIVFPGTEIAAGELLVGAIRGAAAPLAGTA